ncbi:MAG: M28 family peptidase, partial [Verrucomicrobiota bacterium]
PMPSPTLFPSAPLWQDWRALCADIGERRAGTSAERRAAHYIAARFSAAGMRHVSIESFPCMSLRRARVEVHARKGARWQRVDATALVGAPGTPGGRAVTGELVWLELPENGRRIARGSLRGKIAMVFGPLPTEVEVHKRLVAAEPLAVVHIDDRLPFIWTKNDGVYPHWARAHGMPPTLAVPYLDAWRWRRDGIRKLRVRSELDLREAESQNVIAEWPGTDPTLPAIVLTAHHDTQCGNEGADDNASGVVALLALARVLRRQRLRRTVRLISFGTEEQLSVGSAAYVRSHRPTTRHVGLVINFDSIASPLGHWWMFITGAERFARFSIDGLARRGLDVDAKRELIPFSDHFPFNRAGIPSLWFMRVNFPGGRWQHHSPHDTLENVSAIPVQQLLGAVHPFVTALAKSEKWPFPTEIPSAQLNAARRIGRELYG